MFIYVGNKKNVEMQNSMVYFFRMKKVTLVLSIVSALSMLLSIPSFAEVESGWSLGPGYHNPPDATAGLNFMYLWTNWAVELGIGYIGSNEQDNTNSNGSSSTTTTYTVGGDFNLKYLFSSGTFRPYLQGGVGTGVSTSNNGAVGAGVDVTHPFGGGGFYLFGNSFYFYASYIFLNASEFQVGLGF